jgi:hypothetical protein
MVPTPRPSKIVAFTGFERSRKKRLRRFTDAVAAHRGVVHANDGEGDVALDRLREGDGESAGATAGHGLAHADVVDGAAGAVGDEADAEAELAARRAGPGGKWTLEVLSALDDASRLSIGPTISSQIRVRAKSF